MAAADSFEHQLPPFHIGQHISHREGPLSDLEYGHLLNFGVSFATTPVTNSHFKSRIFELTKIHLQTLTESNELPTSTRTLPRAEPIVPPLTPDDTSLFPSPAVNTFTAYLSPWIDLASANPVIASISRQVLNLEINYANFCGIKSIVIAGPAQDASKDGGNQGVAQYARAIQEALTVGSRMTIQIHTPMYREPNKESIVETLSSLSLNEAKVEASNNIDLYTAWDSWHQIRTVCSYNQRLMVALKLPKVMPEQGLQDRWFCEPLHYLTLDKSVFQLNKRGMPSLSRHHQKLIFTYMRLKAVPWLLLCNAGPDVADSVSGIPASDVLSSEEHFPTLGSPVGEDSSSQAVSTSPNAYLAYLRWLESQQPPLPDIESPTLTTFQDWLQSPLQPLSDNLESATYEVFEGDPVKYRQYELATKEALIEWKRLGKPTSKEGVVVIAVAGSGRGPLVTRALNAAAAAEVPVEVWAVEKNPNAYVYLLRQNATVWGGKVNVVKTDMRAWKGPPISENGDPTPVYGKIDILISELLGSFGDNELSPECLDGIQHVMAKPHGISIPSSYTAHFTPISTPKLYADILARSPMDHTAFDTPWVVRLFSLDFNAERVPGHPRFQEAWEFSHPIPESSLAVMEARRSGGVVGGGGGSMAGAAGANDHNSRYCHLTFVCRTRGVTHGLAGYFESTLYESQIEESKGEKVEISTHPERIDQKSRDMISWFPIFFPLKQPLYFPADTELEVSMWRQTDDTKASLTGDGTRPSGSLPSAGTGLGFPTNGLAVPAGSPVTKIPRARRRQIASNPFTFALSRPIGVLLRFRSPGITQPVPEQSFDSRPKAGDSAKLASVRLPTVTIKRVLPRRMPASHPNPSSRISLISRHLTSTATSPRHLAVAASPTSPSPSTTRPASASITSRNMSSQPEHPTLLIPGPIEFDDAVLNSMSHYSESHVGPGFVATFGETLTQLRKLFQTTDPASQPFIISGSGTLGWDLVAANLVEPGEDVLVLSTGYFGDNFAECLKVYGANVTKIDGPVGGRPQLPEIEKALKEKKYKLLTVTHVDTSTGVLSELRDLTAMVKKVSPETLVIVDGVCSVACEEIKFDEWGLDGVVTASQKAIGCPAGLSISIFSGKAMESFKNRKTPPASYFASMKNWTPIMQNYEAKKPSYFATPSPQLVHALNTALKLILDKPLSERFQRHAEESDRIKKAIKDMGLEIVATKPEDQSHAMTAIYLPENVKVPDILPKLSSKGVIFAGGIHKAIATKYIRFGHMGVSVTDPNRKDVDKALDALKTGLAECGFQKA